MEGDSMGLALSFLGSLQVVWDGHPITFATTSTRAMLAYLALEADQPHRRESLASLLWPDQPQAAAFTNLRQTLARLRKALPEPALAQTLLVTPQTLQLALDRVDLDVARFSVLRSTCARHSHPDLLSCAECLSRLEEAAALYRGELLQGLFLEQSQPFEEWLLVRREELHRQAIELLHTLTHAYEQAQDYTAMRQSAARQVALEPWREEAHAALMRALVASGQRSAALVQYQTCARILAEELGIEPGAELRSLAERIRAGELAPLVRPAHAATHNLPAQLTPFVGRETELAELTGLLQAPHGRLLTLVGLGGMGKTRLAIELARSQLAAFPDGVFLVSLAPLAAVSALVPTIAAALRIGIPGGDPSLGGNPRQALLQGLRDKQLLLILDNFEHLMEGVDLVVDILQTAPHVQIIATSRERLNIHGEQQYLVSGLTYSPTANLADAAEAAAVRLFLQRAQRVRPGWQLDNQNLAHVLHICHLVQGMPLGLELAAAWVATLPVTQIAAEIEQSADFLASEWRDMPERHRSIRTVFEWSWRLLSDAEQQVFRHIAVFRGGFTREAAQQVAHASLRILTSLVRKSLLRVRDAADSAGRYEVHELLQQFAADQLNAVSREYREAEARHAVFYLTVAEATGPNSPIREQLVWQKQIEREHDNLRAALAWAQKHGDVSFGLRLAGALWPFWQRRCYLIEGRRWLEYFLTATGAERVAPEIRATALAGAGWLAHDQDDFVRADMFFTKSLQIDRTQGHTGRVASVLAHRGVMARGQGQYTLATALIEESLVLARTAGDRAGIAYALFRLGLVLCEQGNFARAAPIYQECLSTYQALSDQVGVTFARLGLSDIALAEGNLAWVEAQLAECLAFGREHKHHLIIGFTLNILALSALIQGNLKRAEFLAEEAIALFREHGIRGGIVELLITQGQIACAQGEYEQARFFLVDGLERGWPAGPHWLIATGLEELARVSIAGQDAAHAVRLYAAAAVWRTNMGAPIQTYRRDINEATLAEARAILGDDEWAIAWAEGAAWPPTQAIAFGTMVRVL
jgi:predicted ATPase/DNA-binding SARP family transcriptional activator